MSNIELNKTKQPWFHSPLVDTIGMYGLPLLASMLFFFFIDIFGFPNLFAIFAFFAFVDWGHIFAMWFRIGSNPLESKKNIIGYIIIFIVTWFLFSLVLYNKQLKYLEHFLVYFVIFHFIKQQFGIIRIYSKTDPKNKSSLERIMTNTFIYLSMVYPVIWWHTVEKHTNFYWRKFFFDIPFIDSMEVALRVIYILSALFYMYYELRITKRTKMFNIPKNLSVLGAAIGWGCSIIFFEYSYLVTFCVVYTHNIAYFFLIWIVAKRDKALLNIPDPKGFKKIITWTTKEGFILYFLGVNAAAMFILGVINYIVRNIQNHKIIFGNVDMNLAIGWLFPQSDNYYGYYASFVYALYFTIQGTHYFIDGFIWKKEKDFAFHLAQQKRVQDAN